MTEDHFQVNVSQQPHGSRFEHACLLCRAPVRTISHSPLLPTKSSLCMSNPFNPPSPSFHLYSLWALWTTLCVPISSCLNYLYTVHLPRHLLLSLSHTVRLSLSLSEPCELATLSALCIRAYHPRGLERITFLTSLCQMFMTKIDRTTSLKTKSNNAFSKNLTPHLCLSRFLCFRGKEKERKVSLFPDDLPCFSLSLRLESDLQSSLPSFRRLKL